MDSSVHSAASDTMYHLAVTSLPRNWLMGSDEINRLLRDKLQSIIPIQDDDLDQLHHEGLGRRGIPKRPQYTECMQGFHRGPSARGAALSKGPKELAIAGVGK